MPHSHRHDHDMNPFSFTVPDAYTYQELEDQVEAFRRWLIENESNLREGTLVKMVPESPFGHDPHLTYRVYARRPFGEETPPGGKSNIYVLVWGHGGCSIEYRDSHEKSQARAISRASAARIILASKLIRIR